MRGFLHRSLRLAHQSTALRFTSLTLPTFILFMPKAQIFNLRPRALMGIRLHAVQLRAGTVGGDGSFTVVLAASASSSPARARSFFGFSRRAS